MMEQETRGPQQLPPKILVCLECSVELLAFTHDLGLLLYAFTSFSEPFYSATDDDPGEDEEGQPLGEPHDGGRDEGTSAATDTLVSQFIKASSYQAYPPPSS